MSLYEKAFVLGSSLPASFLSFLYIGSSYSKAGQPPVDFHLVPWGVLLMYGIMNVLNVHFQNEPKGVNPRLLSFIFGAIGGLLLSFGGRFILEYPKKVFGLAPDKEWAVHILAMLLYGVIFAILLQFLNKRFGLVA